MKFLKGKLTYISIFTLALGALAQVLGIDIASTETDALVSAVATIGALFGRWRAAKG